MNTPFEVEVASEARSVEPGRGTLWATVTVRATGRALEAARAPLAVVLALDVSGSMRGAPLAHVVQSCEVVARLLGPGDQLAIVTFGSEAGVRCGLTTVDEPGRARLLASLRGLEAAGNTNLHAGLQVAAGVAMTAAPGRRRALVLLSDGQPNVGLASADALAGYVRGLGLAVSSLGFGPDHDEDVLDAIATAGSGRYAFIPDPALARVELARAALAHGGIVADHLALRIAPAAGVELVSVLPATPLRHGQAGTTARLGDVFVDEARTLALELALDLGPGLGAGTSGRLAELTVEGRGVDGAAHAATATLAVDVRAGARAVDPEALRAIALLQADAARRAARAEADRGARAAAASLLRAVIARIDALPGFARYDGSPLAELREQLEDEATGYAQADADEAHAHRRKAALAYKLGTERQARLPREPAPVAARLVGVAGPVAGRVVELARETTIGRGDGNDVVVRDATLSRHHARVVFADGGFRLVDMASTSGCYLDGERTAAADLRPGAEIRLGAARFRFEQ